MLERWQSLPLTRPHRRRRVPLGELDRVEPLADRTLHVLRRHVLADAHEALALARVRRLRSHLRETFARHASDRLDPRRELRGDEHAERVVVLDARARLCEERVRRLPPTRRDEEVAVEALAVEDEPTHPSLAALGHELARPRVAEVDDLHDLGADGVELRRDRKRLVVAAQHDRPLARADREVDQAAHAVGEHHADEVVAGEHQRLLRRARGDDDPLGAEAVQGRVRRRRERDRLPRSRARVPARAPRRRRADIPVRRAPRRRGRLRNPPSPPRSPPRDPPPPPPITSTRARRCSVS